MDEAPASSRSAEVHRDPPHADRFAESFYEVHRQRIFLGLSVVGTLLLGPFAINNFFQDRVLLGLVASLVVLCLLVNAVALARGRAPVVSATVLFFASLVGLATAMYNHGLIGILWVYPGVLLFHFVLPRRTANMFNITLVLLAIPMALLHLGPELTTRVAVTLVLLIAFSNIYSTIADVQQAKQAEQRERLDVLVHQLEAQNRMLREAIRMREEVERIARHDLKTPLASIASVPRLLRERRPLDAVEDELLGMVERAALRMLSMVNLSLDLYRMEEGTYRLRAQAVDLGALARTVGRELQGHLDSKRLRLRIDAPARPLHAQGEDLLCYSIVANLLKNAVEASPDGAEVRVVVRAADHLGADCVALDIHNAGGVPPAVRQAFFAKYATHGKPGGMGLGAYSAQLMARVQRGVLRMEGDDASTTLSLRLPPWYGARPRPAARARPSDSAPAPLLPLPELSVLLVDDDEYNIVVLRSLLPSPPLQVRTAVNGRAALEQVRAARPDVIFLDVEMPVMGGIEAVQRIRALQRERGELPSFVAAFSAHEDEATRRRCLEAGFDLYLPKPASREEVFAVLRGEDPVAAAAGQAGLVLVDAQLMHLMPEFLDSRRELAQALVVAAASGQRETVRETAHKLAGSLAMFGFEDASRASRAVEDAAGAEDIAQLRAKCERLVDLLARALPAVRPSA